MATLGASAGIRPGGGGDLHVHVHSPAVITGERELIRVIETAYARVGRAGTYVRAAS